MMKKIENHDSNMSLIFIKTFTIICVVTLHSVVGQERNMYHSPWNMYNPQNLSVTHIKVWVKHFQGLITHKGFSCSVI